MRLTGGFAGAVSLTVFLLVVGGVAGCGCAETAAAGDTAVRPVVASPAAVPVSTGFRVNVIFDATVAAHIPRMRARQADVLSGLDRKTTRAGLYILDQECLEVRGVDDPLPGDPDEALEVLVRLVHPSTRRGTFPEVAWNKMADEVSRDTRPVVCLMETDGDNDRQTARSRQETRAAITRLAALPQLRCVILIGVNPDQRDRVRLELAPLGDTRYRILSADADHAFVLEAVRGALDRPLVEGGVR